MDRTKIYCMGSFKLVHVLKEIEQKGIAIIDINPYQAKEETNAIAYSVCANQSNIPHIGWCAREDFYKDHGYTKVSLEDFQRAWLGDKKVIGYPGCPELKKLVDKLEEEFVFTRKHIGTNNCHFSFIKKEDGTYSFEYIDSDLILPDVNLARFEDFWRKELPKKKSKKTYIGFEGSPNLYKELLPMGLKYPSDGFRKNIIYYLDDHTLRETGKDSEFCREHIKTLSFDKFVLEATIQLYLDSTEERDFQKLMAAYCAPMSVPIIDPNKLAQVVIKPCVSESCEQKFTLSSKKSLKIIL